jgi:hypothetical protein
MRRTTVVGLGVLMASSPLAAQENPFAFTGGSVKSAYIVYDLLNKGKPTPGMSYEVGMAPDRWIMRMVTPFEIAGKKDTAHMLAVTTRDSQYKYNAMGTERGEGEVSATLRPYLAREYAALDAAGKARFRENLRVMAKSESGSSGDADAFITLTGDKTGSETIAGHKCDVYKRGRVTACVMPRAPLVMLRWSNEKDGVSMVARKVTLNGTVPPAASVLPKGVQWKKTPYDDADFILEVWALKKQSDPEAVPAGQLTKFAVGYLASPAATAELREMSGSMGGGDEPEAEDESEEDQSSEE